MVCPKCGSNNVNVNELVVSNVVNKYHGLLWWLCIGWWWIPVKWFFLTIPAIILFILKLAGLRPKKVVTTLHKRAICQNCGNSWNL